MKNEFEIYLESRFRLNTIRGIINEIKLYEHWSNKENLPIEKATYNDILTYITHLTQKKN
jgi:site-specific recombinase XerD